jgi:SNW domain-containing protein 1
MDSFSFCRILPAPKHNYEKAAPVVEEETAQAVLEAPQNQKKSVNSMFSDILCNHSFSRKKLIPPYPNRLGFLPLGLEDFEDGGAYPEIHVAQYPLNMGKPNHKSSALVPVQLNENGAIRTDIIVKQGSNKNKLVQSQMSDIKEKKLLLDEMAPPTEEEEQATAERTRQALEALLDTKIKSAKPTSGVTGNAVADPQYIRYTPNADAPGYKEETSQRIIKMVEAQVDPMEPPKHKHSKVPHRPPSPPVPVLHPGN